ncbi:response regulator transcription factor [Paenibacillus abyssi]|uniref:AraC family transcriptional regulator n=1 Tax=Paenibacillus abyssi TaxID=1340531 RepID=A0A917FUL3_9BACL|nr:response regulator transcription factor [Paenibacillus abyssi]GGG02802.1 AraC family transcriptional regulator [Paenibacillus abyssi]
MWKIALIDDDRQVLKSMKKLIPLEELDAECVVQAMDGQQGLDKILEHQPDIIITDIYMPVMDGLEMIERLRNSGYDGKIIILSGYSDFEYARKALRLNVDDYLSKPVTLQTIQAVLQKTVDELENSALSRIEHDKLKQKLELYEPYVQKQSVKSLLSGPETGKLHSDLWGHVPKLRSYSRFAVMGIELVRTVRVTDISIPDWNLFRFMISNVLQEILNEECPDAVYSEMFSHHAGIILPIPADAEEAAVKERMVLLAKRIISCVNQYLRLQIRIGLGSIRDGHAEIAVSTEEAFHALRARHAAVSQEVEVYIYDPLLQVDVSPVSRPIHIYQQLADFVRQGQEEKARGVIHEAVKDLAQIGIQKPSQLQKVGEEIWTILSYALYDVGMALEEIVPYEAWHKSLSSVTSVEEFGRWLEQMVQQVCGHHGWYENVKHKQAIQFILDYIHDHFSEDITLQDLAEKVFISRNHLSYIFRNVTGETFNTYLTRVRMEKAKSMIVDGGHLIYEVAGKVGYKNVPYFSTLFKKYTGFNPSDLVKRHS